MSEDYQLYIGTKAVAARPMDKDGLSGYEVIYQDGYKSWSPQQTFEDAYRNAKDMGIFSYSNFSGLMGREKDE